MQDLWSPVNGEGQQALQEAGGAGGSAPIPGGEAAGACDHVTRLPMRMCAHAPARALPAQTETTERVRRCVCVHAFPPPHVQCTHTCAHARTPMQN